MGASAFAGCEGVDSEPAFEFCVGAAYSAVMFTRDDGSGGEVVGWVCVER